MAYTAEACDNSYLQSLTHWYTIIFHWSSTSMIVSVLGDHQNMPPAYMYLVQILLLVPFLSFPHSSINHLKRYLSLCSFMPNTQTLNSSRRHLKNSLRPICVLHLLAKNQRLWFIYIIEFGAMQIFLLAYLHEQADSSNSLPYTLVHQICHGTPSSSLRRQLFLITRHFARCSHGL